MCANARRKGMTEQVLYEWACMHQPDTQRDNTITDLVMFGHGGRTPYVYWDDKCCAETMP